MSGPLTRHDRAHDRDDPDGVLVVLEVSKIPAHEYGLATGITVADVYDEYSPADPVVICAYERVLERYGKPWEVDRLRDVGAPLHYYPASKLERYDAGNYSETAEGCRCEHCQSVVPTATDWVEHVVRACPSVE